MSGVPLFAAELEPPRSLLDVRTAVSGVPDLATQGCPNL
jgi:hypothetical protein